jgi:alginate biosynthesis protein AlgX
MRFHLGLYVFSSFLFSCAAMAQPIGINCPELTDESAFPSDIRSLAPLDLDPETGWVLTDYHKLVEFGFSDEGVALMTELVRILQEQTGTQLVTVATPPRALFAPNASNKDLIRSQYENLQTQLRRSGAIVPDIMGEVESTPDAIDRYYFRADSHWTPYGALLSAQAVAKALAASGFEFESSGQSPYILTGDTDQIVIHGNLIRAVETVCRVELPGEISEFPTIAPATENDIATALFEDDETLNAQSIVLVGSSFSDYANSDRFRWGDSLRLNLQSDVTNMSVAGGALSAAFTAYAQTELKNDKPDLLIWEFLPHYIRSYTGGRLRDIIASVIGDCAKETGAARQTVPLTNEEWSEEFVIPIGHHILNLTLPGQELGTVRFQLKVPEGNHVSGIASRQDRIATDRRSDEWSFYIPQSTDSGMVATGGLVRFKVDGMTLPLEGEITSCSSKMTLR